MHNAADPIFDLSAGMWGRAIAATEAPAPVIYDRSTLQRWAECPQQAWLLERHKTAAVGSPAVVGEEVHKVLSLAMYGRQHDAEDFSTIKDGIVSNALYARPDVQPDVVAVLRKSAYALTSLLCNTAGGRERHPDDLLLYDGGKGERSGQLAHEIIPGTDKRPAVIVTGEVDLLIATASAAEVELHDWKSGWTHWTATTVRYSFQFQTYAWLVFKNFESVERITVRVWNLRDAEATSPIVFNRDDIDRIEKRIVSAVRIAEEYRNATEAPPGWPMLDKCELCPVAAHCEYAKEVPESLIATDPATYLKHYSVTVTREKQMRDRLTKKVRAEGQDFHADGLSFGTDKPKKSVASKCELYGGEE